jgi:sororin
MAALPSHSCALISFHQKSELDKWAVAMNAEFEAAEQFELLIE